MNNGRNNRYDQGWLPPVRPPGLDRFPVPTGPAECRFVGCTEQATTVVQSKYGAPWVMCKARADAAEPVLFIGQPSDSGMVTKRPL